jgi:hypothetical protein
MIHHSSLSNEGILGEKSKLIDFGVVEMANVKECHRTVTLHNSYDKDIIITGVKTSCDCTASNIVSGMIIPRNKDISMDVRLSIFHAGSINTSIFVTGHIVGKENSPVQIVINIAAVAVVPAFIEPQATVLGPCISGEAAPITKITVVQGGSRIYNWDDIEIQSSKLAVLDKRFTNDGITIVFSPKLDGGQELGGFSDSFHIYLLSHGKQINYKPLTSNVIWDVVNPDLSKNPAMVYLGGVHRNEAKSGKIIVRSVSHASLIGQSAISAAPDIAEVVSHQLSPDVIEIDYRIKMNPPVGKIAFLIKNDVLSGRTVYHMQTPVMGYAFGS